MASKKKLKVRKKCPDCGGRKKMRFFVRGKYNLIVSRASDNFGGGMDLCKNEFHGVGGWTS